MSDLKLQQLEQLWQTFLARLKDTPDLTPTEFSREHPDSAEEICRLFPMMRDLREFAKDPYGTPEKIGPYTVVRQLGFGGMGVVYEGTNESLRKRVAIKVLEPTQVAPSDAKRLKQEAELVATLHHSNIVPVYELGEFEGSPYYTMLYIDGPNLATVLHQGASPEGDDGELAAHEERARRIAGDLAENWPLQIDLMRQAASAIGFAHSKGVLHRDVKPANFLIDEAMNLWVTDFGLATSPAGQQRMTVRSKVLGTPRYMAPEQIRGEADERSDIFGLGITFYEMCLLQKEGGNGRKRIWKGGLRPPRELNPSVPVDMERLIMKAVSLDPAERHASVDEYLAELDKLNPNIAQENERRSGLIENLQSAAPCAPSFEPCAPSFKSAKSYDSSDSVEDEKLDLVTAPIVQGADEIGVSDAYDYVGRLNECDDLETYDNSSRRRLAVPKVVLLGLLGLTAVAMWIVVSPIFVGTRRDDKAGQSMAAHLNAGTSTEGETHYSAASADLRPNIKTDLVESAKLEPGSSLVFRVADRTQLVGSIADSRCPPEPVVIRGADARFFTYDGATGTLSFREAVDYEVPRDENLDNVYEIRLAHGNDDPGADHGQLPIAVSVLDVNESPTFVSQMFVEDNTIVVRESNARYPTALEITDDQDSIFSGLHVSVTGGADERWIGMTPLGVFAFVSPVTSQSPVDADQNGVYEIQVAVSDSSQAYFARLEAGDSGQLALYRDRLGRGATLVSELMLMNFDIRRDVIDFATADGETFYHLHPEEGDCISLYQSRLIDGQLSTQLLSSDCELPTNTVALATVDGSQFTFLARRRGKLIHGACILQADGAFDELHDLGESQLSGQISGLSWLDQNRFQHLRRTGPGTHKFYFSFRAGSRFVNMPLSDEPQFRSDVLGHAAWVSQGPESNTTTRAVNISLISD